MNLHTDCDVFGACNIHCSANICPSILCYSFFYRQAAITPQESPSIRINLQRRFPVTHEP